MLEWLNSNRWMALAYVVVAVPACLYGIRERSAQKEHHATARLPAFFWFSTSMLFVSMAIAHSGELGGAVADYARRGAYADGWYDARRSIQVVVVATLAVLWALVTALALWRFPARRRRYLPMTLVTTTLLCFLAIRLVSLHQVDALLYRHNLEGLQIGVIVEFFLVATSALLIDSGRRNANRPLHSE